MKLNQKSLVHSRLTRSWFECYFKYLFMSNSGHTESVCVSVYRQLTSIMVHLNNGGNVTFDNSLKPTSYTCFAAVWTAKFYEDLGHYKVSTTKLTASFFFLFLQYHCEEVQTKGTAPFDPEQNN